MVADDANGCFQNHHNPLLFGQTFDTDVVSCGLPELGPYATGTAELFDEKDWRLHVRAAASGGISDEVATAYVNAQWRDVFTVVADPSTPDAPVPVFIRLRHRRDIQNPPFSFLRFELEVQREFGPTVHFQRDDYGIPPPGDPTTGEHEFQRDIPIGEFPPGTRLRVDAALDAVAESGGCCGTLPDGTVVDPKEAEANVSVSLCSAIAGAFLQGASGSSGDCGGTGDVAVLSVEPVQSVFSVEPLVAGKDAVIKLELSHTFPEPTDAWVTFSINQAGTPAQEFTERITLAVDPATGPCAKKRYYFPGSLVGMAPDSCATSPAIGSLASVGPVGAEPKKGTSPYTISVKVTPVEGEDADPSNDTQSVTRQVADTQLILGHVQIAPLQGGAYSAMPAGEFGEAVASTNVQTQAMFPLGPAGFFGDTCRNGAGGLCEHLGTPLGQCQLVQSGSNWQTCRGIHLDGLRAYQIAKTSDAEIHRAVVVVPAGYFGYHGLRTTPQSEPNAALGRASSEWVLVASDAAAGHRDGSRIPVGPHELSHSLLGNPAHFNSTPEGYWVGCQTALGLTTPECEVPMGARNLMSESLVGIDPPNVWVDAAIYAELLAELRIDPDPAILVVTGTVRRGGPIEIVGLLELPGGRVSRSRPDDLAVETVDGNGQILSRITSIAMMEDGFGLISLTIEYPPETARLRFMEGQQVLLEVDPLSGTLRHAIEGVPDRGFVRNPTQRRNAMLNKVSAFEKELLEGALEGALGKLDNDLRKHARDWLADFVNERAGVEFTRSDVLIQIDRVEARIRARIASREAPIKDDD